VARAKPTRAETSPSLTVGDLVTRIGCHKQTIRTHAARLGLPYRRGRGNTRIFTETEAQRVTDSIVTSAWRSARGLAHTG
jgi:hypothetical protein